MSNIDKQALRERYSEKPAPKCHICGSAMTIQRAGAGGVVYGCTGRIDKDGEGYKFAEGRDFADDHYARSRVTVADESDPDVLALLDENLQLQRDKDSLEAVAIAMRDDMRDAREKLEDAENRIAEHNFENRLLANADRDIKALRQRIAELEARTVTVNLPEGYVVTPAKANIAMIRAGGQAARKYLEEHGGNSPQVIYQAMLAAAGIGVKGE